MLRRRELGDVVGDRGGDVAAGGEAELAERVAAQLHEAEPAPGVGVVEPLGVAVAGKEVVRAVARRDGQQSVSVGWYSMGHFLALTSD